jgi:hypothetical protein
MGDVTDKLGNVAYFIRMETVWAHFLVGEG